MRILDPVWSSDDSATLLSIESDQFILREKIHEKVLRLRELDTKFLWTAAAAYRFLNWEIVNRNENAVEPKLCYCDL